MENRAKQRGVAIDASIPVIRFTEIDSTSGYARAQIAADRLTLRPVAFVAAKQSAGIGRFGRAWSSPEGGLWMTLAWPADLDNFSARLDGLGLRIGVACLRVVQRALVDQGSDAHVRLKWPNDVLVRGHKVLGVLTEIVHGPVQRPWILVGVGINANFRPGELPDPISRQATTLQHELGRRVDLGALEADMLAELHGALTSAGLSKELLAEAAASLHGLDRDTTISLPDGTRISGVLTGLNEHGMAVLDIDGRAFVPPPGSVVMGEVSEKR